MNKKFPKVYIKIQYEDFDVSKETQKLHHNLTGAIVNFVGLVRGHNENDNQQISSMTLEHYPGMTEAEIDKIVQKSIKKWDLTGITVIHRVGKLFVSDQIVFVGVSSMHRQNAFDACNFIMDWLKTKAPFWKVEENNNHRSWVSSRQSDQEATKKWES
jgi:molybdopterin synthase catalytic subunit